MCPGCGQGTLINQIITAQSEGCSEEVDYYSCGHRHFRDMITATLVRDVSIGTKLKLGNKVGRKPEQEIYDRADRSDRAHPERPVINTIYKQRTADRTSVFHTAAYGSGELKHIDCKTKTGDKMCDNSWRSSGEEMLENHFAAEIGNPTNIRCLRCGASFTRP